MAVLVEQQLGLGTQLGHQLGDDVGVQGHQVLHGDAAHGAEDPVTHAGRGVVAGAVQPEAHRRRGVSSELGLGDQPVAVGGHPQHEGTRPADQGAVEIEEGGGGAVGRVRRLGVGKIAGRRLCVALDGEEVGGVGQAHGCSRVRRRASS